MEANEKDRLNDKSRGMDFRDISGRIFPNLYVLLRTGVCPFTLRSVNRPVTARIVDARLVDICRNPIGLTIGFNLRIQSSKHPCLMTISNANMNWGADSPMDVNILTSCNSVSFSFKLDSQYESSGYFETFPWYLAISFCNSQCFFKWMNGKWSKSSLGFFLEIAAKMAGWTVK